MSWKLVYTNQAKKDAKKVSKARKVKLLELLELISKDPFANLPSYESLQGSLKGAYSRRISIQHRLVYQVYEDEKVIKVIRVWTHYE